MNSKNKDFLKLREFFSRPWLLCAVCLLLYGLDLLLQGLDLSCSHKHLTGSA
ncbi:MAG: hypothetical protein QG657_3441 [Acidobacteriota bacterium]|nr:hypothetical protein [Acidobacteriota bacterium]